MDLKLVKTASVRKHMDAHYRGEISYSKAIDLINKDANKQLLIGGVSHSVATEYAEFCVRCDREKLPLLCLEDYIKQYCG